ncbi:MAG: hypothetical protein IPM83_11825 [Ignavibacteria bacterium]|nr:hypothetical protein [Ignavibacteria bacterium]
MIALALVVVSCSSNDPVSPQPTTINRRQEARFHLNVFSTDPTTGEPISSTKLRYTATITQTGLTFLGKTNVSKMRTEGIGEVTDAYIYYDPNGDFSVAALYNNVPTGWVTWPVASHTKTENVIADTTYSVGGISISNKATATIYVGTGNHGDRRQGCYRGQDGADPRERRYLIRVSQTISLSQDGYFAPTIGFFAKTFNDGQLNPVSGEKMEGVLSVLVAYDLK